MKRKNLVWGAFLAGSSACTPAAETARDFVTLQGVWEAQHCQSVETNARGRRVFARTDVYPAGQVVCEITPTEVRHYRGGHVQVRAHYTRTPAGYRLGEAHGLGAVRLPDDSGEVAIDSLTRTRLVIRQAIPSSDSTTLTSTITYARRTHLPTTEQ